MARIASDMSISLDGYVTGPNASAENPFGDGAGGLHDWLFKDPTPADQALLQEAIDSCGAVVMGRTSFDKTVASWGPDGPLAGVPNFVVTHTMPTTPYSSAYTFVTDGVESALRQASAAAGEKVVGLHGATVLQQALPLGLVDEIVVHVVPILLGGGTRLFDALDQAIELRRTDVIVTPLATHLRYDVVR